MKKIIFVLMIFSIVCFSAVSTENSDLNSKSNSENPWKGVGEQGAKALKETGKFFKSVGDEVGSALKDSVKSAVSIKCYGNWLNKGKSVKTTIECNENGSMVIAQKQGLDTDYWSGVFTVTLNSIVFSVKESGHRSLFSKVSKDVDYNWYIFYVLKEDGTLKITSSDIPSTKDGLSFAKGVSFFKN